MHFFISLVLYFNIRVSTLINFPQNITPRYSDLSIEGSGVIYTFDKSIIQFILSPGIL